MRLFVAAVAGLFLLGAACPADAQRGGGGHRGGGHSGGGHGGHYGGGYRGGGHWGGGGHYYGGYRGYGGYWGGYPGWYAYPYALGFAYYAQPYVVYREAELPPLPPAPYGVEAPAPGCGSYYWDANRRLWFWTPCAAEAPVGTRAPVAPQAPIAPQAPSSPP